jgi:hypothetical protein
VLVGLNEDEMAAMVEIRWPSGAVQKLDNVKAGQVVTVKEPETASR